MHAKNEELAMNGAAERVDPAGEPKEQWVTPAVRQLRAGSAEDAFGSVPDAGQSS